MTLPRTLLVDHGSSANLGDTAMLEGCVHELRDVFPDVTIHMVDRPGLRTALESDGIAVRHAPYAIWPLRFPDAQPITMLKRRLHRVYERHVRRRSPREAWDASLLRVLRKQPATTLALHPEGMLRLGEYCRRFDGLHVVGGGNLTDVFRIGATERVCLVRAFLEQGKPVVLTGQQIGPFQTEHYRDLVAETLRQVGFVGLREPTDSVAFCEDAGLPAQRFEVMGDDSFGLATDQGDTARRLLAARNVPDGYIAVNVRVGKYAAEHAEHIDRIAETLDRLWEIHHRPFLIVPIALNRADSDIASGRALKQRVSIAEVRVLDDQDLTPSLVKAILGRAWGCLGVSYHFATFALSQAVPAVCMYSGAYYSQKARGVAAFWGDDRLAVSLDGSTAGDLVEHVYDVFEDGRLRDHLRVRADEATRMWRRTFHERSMAAYC